MYSRHKSGAIAELKAAQYFLSKDYEIFFPTTQSSVDFIARKNKELIRVQVKSAYLVTMPSGKSYLRIMNRRKRGTGIDTTCTDDDYDVLVGVYGDRLWVFHIDVVSKLREITLEKNYEERKLRRDTFDSSTYEITDAPWT